MEPSAAFDALYRLRGDPLLRVLDGLRLADQRCLSVIFLMFQYFGPGMIKSFLTLRTGNAWVHVWAYHAIAPHVTVDTTNIVNVFRIS